MTLEELQAELETEKQKNKELSEENEKLKVNEKQQNSYITKLEAERKRPEDKISNPTLTDKRLSEYLARNMRRDTIEEGLAIISQSVEAKVLECLKPELISFLDKTMTIEKTSTSYVIDAFNLLYGKAMSNKDHVIHSLEKEKENPPVATPQAATPTQSDMQTKQAVSEQLKQFMTPPPAMTPGEPGAQQTPPETRTPIATTKDAMSAFKDRIKAQGGNRFS